MQYLVLGMRFLIGAVFLASTFGKLARSGGLGRFTDSVREMRLLPERLARPVALAVVAGEGSVCVLLAVPSHRATPAGLALASALLAVFTVAIALALRRGVRAPCQCFGASTTPLGARHLVRNVLLVAAAVAGAAGSSAQGSVHLTGALVAASCGLLAGGVVAALDELHDLFASGEPVKSVRPTHSVRPPQRDPKETLHALPHRSCRAGGSAQHPGSDPHRRRDQATA